MKQEKKLRSLATLYRIDHGKKFRLQDFDPGDTGGLPKEFKEESEAVAAALHAATCRDAGQALRAGSLGAAADLSGNGRGGQGWHHQACDERGESAGLSGVLVQDAFRRKNSLTATCGERRSACRNAAKSGSSIVPTTKRSWWCACIRNCWRPSACPRPASATISGRSASRTFPPSSATPRATASRFAKFFLNLSKEEQKRRFLARLDEPEKNWKFSAADVRERRFWDDYQQNYEDMIRHTASKHAPWIVVPADNKWFARLVVSSVIVHALQDMKLSLS